MHNQILKAKKIMDSTGDARIIFSINEAATKLKRRQHEFKTDAMRTAKEIYIKNICRDSKSFANLASEYFKKNKNR